MFLVNLTHRPFQIVPAAQPIARFFDEAIRATKENQRVTAVAAL
jgi:hypothetical protein